ACIVLHQSAPSNGSAPATAVCCLVPLRSTATIFPYTTLFRSPYKLFSSTTAFPASCSGTPQFSGSQTSYTHTGLTNGTTYYYRDIGTANACNPASSSTPIPSPPSSNTAAPGGTLAFTPSATYT